MDKRRWVLTKVHTDTELARQDVYITKELIEVMPFIEEPIQQKGFKSLSLSIGSTHYTVYKLDN